MTRDPLRPVLTALSSAVGVMEETRDAMREGAHGLSPEGEQALVLRVAQMSGHAMTKQAQEIAWRSSLLAGACGLALLLAGYGFGLWRGGSAARGEMVRLETAWGEAARREPGEARAALDFMRWNNLQKALDACRAMPLPGQVNGQAACSMPIWLAPEGQPVPGRGAR